MNKFSIPKLFIFSLKVFLAEAGVLLIMFLVSLILSLFGGTTPSVLNNSTKPTISYQPNKPSDETAAATQSAMLAGDSSSSTASSQGGFDLGQHYNDAKTWSAEQSVTITKKSIPFWLQVMLFTSYASLGLIGIYVISLFGRHMNGQPRPFLDDVTSFMLFAKLRKARGVGFFDRQPARSKGQRTVSDRTTQLVYRAYRHIAVTIMTYDDTTQFHVAVALPNNDNAANRIKSDLKSFDTTINGQAGQISLLNSVTFGQAQFSDDLRYMEWKAVTDYTPTLKPFIQSKVKRSDTTGETEQINDDIQSAGHATYPLSLFNDNSQVISDKTAQLQSWSNGLAKDVENWVVKNQNIPARLLRVDASNTTVSVIFDMQNINSRIDYEKLPELLETNLKPDGKSLGDIQAFSGGGKLTIQFTAPKELQVPIDNRTQFTKAFPNGVAKNFSDSIFGVKPDGSTALIELIELPHLLVAGTTNSGKSVFLNFILFSTMYHLKPDELKLVVIDPKKVEFAVFKDSPFMLMNPITDMDKAMAALTYLVELVEDRYETLSQMGVKKFTEYNDIVEKNGGEKMPYIIGIIDEYSNLMGSHPEVEGQIVKLAEKARAAGVSLIVATQRPSADVITGVVKANLPNRVALMVADSINSDIIIDQPGAEKLAGRGDMLIKLITENELIRAQSGYISNEEIARIMDYLKATYPAPELFDIDAYSAKLNGEGPTETNSSDDGDILFRYARDNADNSNISEPTNDEWETSKQSEETQAELADILSRLDVPVSNDEPDTENGADDASTSDNNATPSILLALKRKNGLR